MTVKHIDHFKVTIELKNGEQREGISYVKPSLNDRFVSIHVDDDTECHYNTDMIAHVMVESVGV